jgi:hypothetical protein
LTSEFVKKKKPMGILIREMSYPQPKTPELPARYYVRKSNHEKKTSPKRQQ